MVLGEDGLCPIAILLPFTDRGRPSKVRDIQTAFTHMASAVMAMEDFNRRDPSVVKQLADNEYSLESCGVRFPLPWDNQTGESSQRLASVIEDDGDQQDKTANALLSTLYYMRRGDRGDDVKNNHHLCAVAGSVANLPARTASTLAAASDVPYFSHAADTTKISRPSLYPLSGKTSADEYARGDAIISYFDSIGRDKVVLVYSHTNEDVLNVTSKAAKDYDVDLRYEPVSPPWDGTTANTPYDAMKRIKESGFKTVVLSVPRMSHWEHIAREAERWGVNTDEYVWFVWEPATDLHVLASARTHPGSEMDNLLRGMGSVRVLDGYDWQSDNKFLAHWKGQGSTFVEKLNFINPIDQGKPGFFRAEADYFKNYMPMPFSSYMYDTVIALGMGACRTQKIQRQIQVAAKDKDLPGGGRILRDGIDNLQNPDGSYFNVEEDGTLRRLQKYIKRSGQNLQFNETAKVTFDGASGFVKLSDGKYFTRDDKTIGFGVYNLHPVDNMPPLEDDSQEMRSYKYAITSKRIPGQPWAAVPGEPFIYADGTSTQPTPVREVFENNYLSPPVRACGFALFSTAAFICVGLAAWTFAKRKSTIVKAAQPEFLYLLSFGSLASLIAIITLSFDESYGASVDTLSMMCTATPWLFFTGYIIVNMALFSKLRRINSVLTFRRRIVKVHHVILPAVTLTLIALIILALWTALDPWVWVRKTTNDDTGATFGKCTSNNATAYLVSLAVIMIVATLLAAMMAYKTKDIPSAFSESGPIFVAIVAQLEVWFVGIPILIIVDNVSADATYLGRVLIIWTFALTMVLTVIGPKFLKSQGCCLHIHQTNGGRYNGGSGAVRITGHSTNNTSNTVTTHSENRNSGNSTSKSPKPGTSVMNAADVEAQE